MKSQNNLNTDVVEESVAVSCNPGAHEGDISKKEELTTAHMRQRRNLPLRPNRKMTKIWIEVNIKS